MGASTFAAVLAWVAEGILIDLDGVGGGVDVRLGIEHLPGARWSGLHLGGGWLDPVRLAAGLPRWRGVRVLSADAPPPPGAVAAVCAAAADMATAVVDVPRVPCELRAAAVDAADVVLVLTRCTVAGLAAARCLLAGLDASVPGVVVRRGEVPLADARAELTAPVVAAMPASCAVSLATRPPPRRLARIASGVLDALGPGGPS